MNSKVAAGPEKKIIIRAKRTPAKGTSYPVGGVSESSLPVKGTERKVERMLSDIVTRLERIEEKIDENIYPPESAIKPEFIKRVKRAQADIRKGKGKMYNSIDDFFKEIEA
jgi:hypothetical protein